jgi:hypothetical protein
MSFFSDTVAAVAAGRTVNASLLVFMDFAGGERRWWTGYGNLEAGGFTWEGAGELVGIEGLQTAIGTAAPQTTFQLSGVDSSVVAAVRDASDEVKGRLVRVYIQFFEVSPAGDDQVWANLDEPHTIWTGRMDQIRYTADGASRTVTVTAESRWVGRNRPPFGAYTYEDQVARFPGDLGLKQVASLVNKTIRWPEF